MYKVTMKDLWKHIALKRVGKLHHLLLNLCSRQGEMRNAITYRRTSQVQHVSGSASLESKFQSTNQIWGTSL